MYEETQEKNHRYRKWLLLLLLLLLFIGFGWAGFAYMRSSQESTAQYDEPITTSQDDDMAWLYEDDTNDEDTTREDESSADTTSDESTNTSRTSASEANNYGVASPYSWGSAAHYSSTQPTNVVASSAQKPQKNTPTPSAPAQNPTPNEPEEPEEPAPAQSVMAIDSANTINDPAWFEQVYDDGFRLYIMHSTAWGTCDAWYNTENQLGMALDAGLKIAVYTRDPNCWEGGINAAGPYKDDLQFFAIDVENDPGHPVTRDMVDGIKAMNVRPVIYSGAGMWPGVQGATANDFADVPLWDTNASAFDYADWQVDHLWPTPIEYGGWNTQTNMRIGVQQQFEYTLHGINVDLNSFDADFLID